MEVVRRLAVGAVVIRIVNPVLGARRLGVAIDIVVENRQDREIDIADAPIGQSRDLVEG